jgi:predicted  nucleic acid-binding Zn-ribbon protein
MADSALDPQIWDALRRLAYLDGTRTSTRRRVAELREQAAHDVELERRKAALTAAKERLKQLRVAQREADLHAQELRDRRARTEKRLAAGLLTGAREVAAAEDEIAQLQQALRREEDVLLSLMVEEEGALAAESAAQQALTSEQPEAERRMHAAAQEAASAEARLKEIDTERRAAAHLIPAPIRERYRALFNPTGGHPFAFAEAGECGYCHRPLPGAVVQAVRAHSGVPQCPACSRLLLDSG